MLKYAEVGTNLFFDTCASLLLHVMKVQNTGFAHVAYCFGRPRVTLRVTVAKDAATMVSLPFDLRPIMYCGAVIFQDITFFSSVRNACLLSNYLSLAVLILGQGGKHYGYYGKIQTSDCDMISGILKKLGLSSPSTNGTLGLGRSST